MIGDTAFSFVGPPFQYILGTKHEPDAVDEGSHHGSRWIGHAVELRQLEYFVAVAEEGGFGRAAQRLSIVQSAVSQQIGRLERELSVRLFDRSRRYGAELTDAGLRLLSEARAVLAAAQQIRLVAAGIAAGSDGVLRLGTVHAPDNRVYRALNELATAAPRLQISPRRLPPPERLAAVRSGELDAALVRALRGLPNFELVDVWSDPLYVALPADHSLAEHPSLRLEQLAQLPLRLCPREANPPFHDLISDACRRAGIGRPAGPPFTTLHQTLTDIASATPSWTVFYEVGPMPTVHRVAIRPLEDLTVNTSIAVARGTPAPAVRHLVEALRQVSHHSWDESPPR